MFSYLRPHHKRHGSIPSSPDPSSVPPPIPSPSLQSPEFFSSSRILDDTSFTSNSPVSPYPPQLPPIPRVASQYGNTAPPLRGPPRTPPLPQSEQLRRAGNDGHRLDIQNTWQYTPSPSEELASSRQENSRPPAKAIASGAPTGLRSKGQRPVELGAVDSYGESLRALTAPVATASIPAHYWNNSRSQTSLAIGQIDKQPTQSRPASAAQPGKTGKARISLRNPMSLLMRRRSAQTLETLSDESLVTPRSQIVPAMNVPTDFDPSIRGHIVHDFSAPRQKRNFSYNSAYGESSIDEQPETDSTRPATGATGSSGRHSPPKTDRAHTPVFRENFDDETSYESSQAAIRAERLANPAFLSRNSFIPPPPGRSPPLPPPVRKDSPPQQPRVTIPPPEPVSEAFEASALSPVQESESPTEVNMVQDTPKKKMSTKTPPTSRSRATSVTDPSFVPAGLPAHLTSRASRFSFQIAGSDSTQEKVLEERHKQKAAEKAFKQNRISTNTLDDGYDEDAMYDDFDMDGGFEEEIPMLGEDDGLTNQTMSPGMAAFDFSSFTLPTNNPLSPMSMNGDHVAQTPRDAHGNAIGFAFSETGPKSYIPTGADFNTRDGRGLGLMMENGVGDASKFTPAATPEDKDASTNNEHRISTNDIGDDIYFDDGLIEDQGEGDGVEFDENVFDDPSHPLYERHVKNAPLEDALKRLSAETSALQEDPYDADADEDLSKHLISKEPALAHQPSKAHKATSPKFQNLDAYHSALADAATRAEAAGRFTRKDSVDASRLSSDDVNEEDSLSGSRPSLIPDDGRFSQETSGFPPDDFGMDSSFVDDYDYSEYDSALEDDPMIAAANAEALANDDDGFYGQEFGFFAAGQGEAQSAYGGFFGSSGLGRSISGRNAVREPNLTPITERSEYSTRNSFISINHFRDGGQPIQSSPGMAQLARMSPYGWPDEDPDMSMHSLMKLKKSAFGGSTGSLGSSTGTSPRNSSPNVMQYYARNSSPMVAPIARSSEFDSDESQPIEDIHGLDDVEEDDEALDAVNAVQDGDSDSDELVRDSPTLNASDYNSLSSPSAHAPSSSPALKPPPQSRLAMSVPPPLTLSTTLTAPQPLDPASVWDNHSPVPVSATSASGSGPRRSSLGLISPISTTSPMTPGAGGAGWRTHSRKGSAADSVTYVREMDEQGGDRWVLERRRTAESGELELVGREIVEGGRI